jgi:flagellar basal body-associated protein FliL
MADEIQKPVQADKKIQAAAPQAPGVLVLAGIMLAGSFLSSFLTAKFMGGQAAAGTAVKDDKTAAADDKSKDGKDKKDVKEKAAYYKLGEFIVNLANKESTRYLKTDITMEVKDAKDIEKALKEKESIYRDAILEKLGSYTTQQLSNTEGKKAMKQDILTSIADLDPEIKVQNIYFNALMMQ